MISMTRPRLALALLLACAGLPAACTSDGTRTVTSRPVPGPAEPGTVVLAEGASDPRTGTVESQDALREAHALAGQQAEPAAEEAAARIAAPAAASAGALDDAAVRAAQLALAEHEAQSAAVMAKVRAERPVPLAAEHVQPIGVGETLPPITLLTTAGEPFDLTASLVSQPAVLVFFRGGWCPYCVRHLAELKGLEPQLLALGYQVLAISPERPEVLDATAKTAGAGYRLLSDADMGAARALGLAYRVDDATRELYRTHGVDLDEISGRQHHLLPVPAALVVSRDGIVRFVFADADYRTRVESAALLDAARAAAP
jgi:peroxiredoxin